MSSLTRWLLVAVCVVVVLFILNAIAYRVRRGTFLPRRAASPASKRALPRSEVFLYFGFALALVIGVSAPILAPGSAFAAWLAEPLANVAYFTWCFLATVIVGVAIQVRVEFANPNS